MAGWMIRWEVVLDCFDGEEEELDSYGLDLGGCQAGGN